jgi:hypothetical protein
LLKRESQQRQLVRQRHRLEFLQSCRKTGVAALDVDLLH